MTDRHSDEHEHVFQDRLVSARASDYLALTDALVVSGDHRLYKPKEAIYRLMEREIGLPPGDRTSAAVSSSSLT